MVLSFFRKGDPTGLDHVESRAVTMLGDARHSFDLATTALLTGPLPPSVAADIRTTDDRINQAEQELRTELVVHVSVQGTGDIATVLGFMLMIKKIERIGDQAKNILDLAESGVSLATEADIDELHAQRQAVSTLFGEAAELLTDPDPDRFKAFVAQAKSMMAQYQEKIDVYIHSERPGREVVPLAIYYRYLKRIVANLLGTGGTSVESLTNIDYLDDGSTDITDD
jgi:Na+/phosphate symporter